MPEAVGVSLAIGIGMTVGVKPTVEMGLALQVRLTVAYRLEHEDFHLLLQTLLKDGRVLLNQGQNLLLQALDATDAFVLDELIYESGDEVVLDSACFKA